MKKDTELQVTCSECGATFVYKINGKDLFDYEKGKHIQDAFPYLDDDARELILSGVCGKCFDKMFSEEDDDE